MAELSIELTPPKTGGVYATMRISQVQPVRIAVKRKTGYQMTGEDIKRIRFDPSLAETDDTVVAVHERHIELTGEDDRKKMRVLLPIDFINKGLARLDKVEAELSATKAELGAVKAELGAARMANRNRDIVRLPMLIANLLSDFVEKAIQTKGTTMAAVANTSQTAHAKTGHQPRRLEQAAESLTNKDLARFGVDQKYMAILKQLPKFLKDRNVAAHESEKEFARLLTEKNYYQQPEYYCWGGMFWFTYGKTVEELAAEDDMTCAHIDMMAFMP